MAQEPRPPAPGWGSAEGTAPRRDLLANSQERLLPPVTPQTARKQMINDGQFGSKLAMIGFMAQKYSRAQRNPAEATKSPWNTRAHTCAHEHTLTHTRMHTNTHTCAALDAHPPVQKGSGRVSGVRRNHPSLAPDSFLSLVLQSRHNRCVLVFGDVESLLLFPQENTLVTPLGWEQLYPALSRRIVLKNFRRHLRRKNQR